MNCYPRFRLDTGGTCVIFSDPPQSCMNKAIRPIEHRFFGPTPSPQIRFLSMEPYMCEITVIFHQPSFGDSNPMLCGNRKPGCNDTLRYHVGFPLLFPSHSSYSSDPPTKVDPPICYKQVPRDNPRQHFFSQQATAGPELPGGFKNRCMLRAQHRPKGSDFRRQVGPSLTDGNNETQFLRLAYDQISVSLQHRPFSLVCTPSAQHSRPVGSAANTQNDALGFHPCRA